MALFSRLSFLILLILTLSEPVRAQLAVGKWRDYFSYSITHQVCQADDRIWCSAEGGLFYYDLDDMTLNRVNKTTGLNDVGISTFAYDPQTRFLVVAYNNANIDLVKDDVVTNISDIKRINIGGNKKINSIRFYNRCAYLACGFGIVVVDLVRKEIKETYYLGENGTYSNINDIAFTESLIVAATDNGIMTADKNSAFLNIVTNWSIDQNSLLAGTTVTRLLTDGDGALLALSSSDSNESTLYVEVGDLNFAPWLSGEIRNIEFSQGRYLVCQKDKVEIYDNSRQIRYSIGDIDWMSMTPNDAILDNQGRLWVAHNWASLLMIEPDNPSSLSSFSPSGPQSGDVFRLTAFDEELMVCPGGHTSTFVSTGFSPDIFTFKNYNWTWLDKSENLPDNVIDIIDVAVNPKKPNQKLAAAWGCGIVEITDNKVTNFFNETNTDGALIPYTEETTTGTFSSLRTGAVAFDNKGNAWITNSLRPEVLAVRSSNGTWRNFNTQNMISGGDIDHIIWDSIHDLKIFWGHANKIYVHDGDSKMAYIDPNNGSKLQTSSLSSLVQDHNGNIWIGTNKGIKIIYNLGNVFQNGGEGEKSPVVCSNIIYNENGISEYLMAYESVTCMAVDGANRKWVGTSSGGLYLISANGLEQVEHFTASNSPLFSDKIVALAVMPWSGELFIGTDKGLQSFRATATYAFSEPLEDIHAFPNPVRPDYDGLIAIKGFTRNALVHITDAAGHTVFSTRANGGQAIWNGRTNSGGRVASGVYFVFASAEDGSMRSATKILIMK